jgi:leader peptidase (prepilin peptidase) / N-methyltransferase
VTTAARIDRSLLAALAVLLTILATLNRGVGPETAVAGFVIVTLILISREDLGRRVIPNGIVLPAWGVVLLSNTAIHPDRWVEWLVSGLAAAGFFLIFALVSPAGLGMGDVKLVGFLGAALGHDVLPAMLLGTTGAAFVALAMLVREGSAARRRTMPLGPFLAAGAIAVLLFL